MQSDISLNNKLSKMADIKPVTSMYDLICDDNDQIILC